MNPLIKKLNTMADEVEAKMGTITAQLESMIQNQQDVSEAATAYVDKANRNMDALQIRLTPYVDGKKPFDEQFERLSDEYRQWAYGLKYALMLREMADESVAEGTLGMKGPVVSQEERAL